MKVGHRASEMREGSRWGRKRRLRFERDALLVRLITDLGFAALVIDQLRAADIFRGLRDITQ